MERVHIDDAWDYLIPRMQSNPLVQSALRELQKRHEERLAREATEKGAA